MLEKLEIIKEISENEPTIKKKQKIDNNNSTNLVYKSLFNKESNLI